MHAVDQVADLVIYMVDHTRRRDYEESKVLGIVRGIHKPKILVINKVDLQEETYLPQYEFLRDEFEHVYKISAIDRKHVKPLLDKIFELLPEENIDRGVFGPGTNPLLNIDSKTFLAELIREKIFLKMGEEIPYTVTAIVDEIADRDNGITYIKARILTIDDRYKRMIIGAEGRKIKEMGSMARKEIELAINKKVFLDLRVEVDPHWQELMY